MYIQPLFSSALPDLLGFGELWNRNPKGCSLASYLVQEVYLICSLFRNKPEIGSFFFWFPKTLVELKWRIISLLELCFMERNTLWEARWLDKFKSRYCWQIPCVNDVNWRTNISSWALVLNLENQPCFNTRGGGEETSRLKQRFCVVILISHFLPSISFTASRAELTVC